MPPVDSYLEKIAQAVNAIRGQWAHQPEAGLVLGTGSGQVAEELNVELRLPYAAIPNFPRSTAIGHKGSLVCGSISGKRVIAMQGRFHLYEGHAIEDTMLPIHVMQRLGIRRLLLSNAAGGVNPSYRVGDLMLIESHLDLFFRASSRHHNDSIDQNLRPGFRADLACDRMLLEEADSVGRALGFVVQRGTYVGLLGPTYETRAEYRMCRRIGGDAVGMSTIPEIATASYYGIPTLAVSIITNVVAADAKASISGHAVIAAAESAAHRLHALFAGAIESHE